VSWNERLDRPIDLPNGKTLLTLEDARLYILQLPRSEIESVTCQIAIEALLIAAEKPDHLKGAPVRNTDRNSNRASESRKPSPSKKFPDQIRPKRSSDST
jgi:hypothetical protein